MSKGQSLQDPFLNALRRERVPVSVYLVNGIKLQGTIESFDQFVVLDVGDRLFRRPALAVQAGVDHQPHRTEQLRAQAADEGVVLLGVLLEGPDRPGPARGARGRPDRPTDRTAQPWADSTSSSTQSRERSTAFFHSRRARSTSSSSVVGSQRLSSSQLATSSSWDAQNPTARPAA